MKKIFIASLSEREGKSTAGISIGLNINKKLGYMKPFGDNPVYKNKKLGDYDALLFKQLFNIDEPMEEMSFGMMHSKIIHYYEDIQKEMEERYKKLSEGKEFFIFEGGENVWRGSSIGFGSIAISSKFNAPLIFIISGDKYETLDKIYYLNSIKNVAGVILNKATKEEFEIAKEKAEDVGINIFGYIPEIKKLKFMKVSYVVEKLSGKIVAGENGINKYIENIFIAALSSSEIKRHPDFKKKNKLIITGGDRSDVITACIDENTSGIILTNNIIPSSNILAKADREELPLISVRPDTYTVARHIENIPRVILPEEKEKIDEIKKKASIDIRKIESVI